MSVVGLLAVAAVVLLPMLLGRLGAAVAYRHDEFVPSVDTAERVAARLAAMPCEDCEEAA